MTTLSAAILLFFVMDPLGNIPLFLAALRPVDPTRRLPITARELLVAYALLVAFLFAGGPLLAVLSISGPALTIAGGIVLFLIAVKMVFPDPPGALGEHVDGEPFIVPLAVPYVAGPSALATLLLLTSREPGRQWDWFLAVSAAWAASAAILLAGAPLSRVLGEKGLTAVERLMGMVLVAVAVQMVLDGTRQFIMTSGEPHAGPSHAAPFSAAEPPGSMSDLGGCFLHTRGDDGRVACGGDRPIRPG